MELFFSSNYDKNNHFLMKVPEKLLNDIYYKSLIFL